MSYQLVIAEKPSVAMSYAKVLGATSRKDGYLEGNGYLVSWCVGHLVELATVYKGNIIKNLIMDCQSYTKYRPNETMGGIFVSWRRKEELPTGA